MPDSLALFLSRGGINALLGFAEAVLKNCVVGDGFFDELFQQEQFRAVNHGVNALLERLHGREGLERVAEQNQRGVPALAHGHVLQRFHRQVLARVIGGEHFLDDNRLIADLAEANEEIAVGCRRVDFIPQLVQSSLGGFEPLRGGKGQQRWFIRRTDELELGGHRLFEFEFPRLRGGGGSGFGGSLGELHPEVAHAGGGFAAGLFEEINAARDRPAFGAVEQGRFLRNSAVLVGLEARKIKSSPSKWMAEIGRASCRERVLPTV